MTIRRRKNIDKNQSLIDIYKYYESPGKAIEISQTCVSIMYIRSNGLLRKS